MTTKEEIIDRAVEALDGCGSHRDIVEDAMDEWAGHLISGSQSVTTIYQIPKHILDEYAKQQAIAFDIWKLKNHWLWNSSICKYFKWEAGDKHETRLTHEEIYSQFIEQQTENK